MSIVMIRLVICALIVSCFETADADKQFHVRLDQNDLECINELGFDSQRIISAFDDNFKIEEENPDINKFFACSWNKSGFIDKNNQIDTAKIRKWLSEWDIRDLHGIYEVNNVKNLNELVGDCIHACFITKNGRNDDFALKMYNCLLDCLLWKRLSR